MEELQPQDIEELLQELEEEDGVEDSLPPEVEELLQDLQPARRPTFRRRAAKQLGEVSRSSRQVVQALVTAAETDSAAVRAAAAKSLRAPVHQEFLQQHPDLMEATERALQQRPRSGPSSGPMDRRRVSGKATAHRTSRESQSLSYYSGLALGELFVRVRRLFRQRYTSATPGEPKARDAQTDRKPSPPYEGDQPSDCIACGAWNAPGSEYCDECGAALEGADLGFNRTLERRATDRHAERHVSGKEVVYRTSDEPQGLSYRLGAALGALFVRIRRSLTKDPTSVTPGEPGAVEPQAARRRSLVSEGDQPSGCTACGAWNAPGSEHCGECGAVLEGAGG
jgi:hypothetical protein